MKNIILLFSLCSAFLFSCSFGGGDSSEIKSLVEKWTKVDPNMIGGPPEMKQIKEIKEINVAEIQESRWVKMGCKDCKESSVTLVCIDKNGETQNIVYQVRKLDGNWAITEWELTGKDKGAFYPFIDNKIIELRENFK
ncbi:hypothetical protein [Ferruginibacter sp.]